MNMTLQIDRLILDGIEVCRGDESRLRTMIESEIARLFAAEAPALRSSSAMCSSPALVSLDGGVIQVASPAATASLARQIAGAVHRALRGGAREGMR